MHMVPESLRLWILCSAMNWCHLPVDGGLYDQSAELLDDWVIIFNQQEEQRKREKRDQDREAERKKK